MAAESHSIVQAGERRSSRVESVRAIAAVGVLVFHCGFVLLLLHPDSYHFPRILGYGAFGVYLFFALTGYLIFLPFARAAWGSARKIDLRRYAINRVLRILPLYYVVLVVLLLILLKVRGDPGSVLDKFWRFALFLENYPPLKAENVDGPMWSLVVEVQFYLLLPLLAWLLWRLSRYVRRLAGLRDSRRAAIVILVVTGLGLVVLRQLTVIDPAASLPWDRSLPAMFVWFIPGMVLALVQIGWDKSPPRWLRGTLSRSSVWFLAALVSWATIYATPRAQLAHATGDVHPMGEQLALLADFLVVGACVLPLRATWVHQVLDWRPLALLGVASYSFYLWHVPIIEVLATRPWFPQHTAILTAVTFGITLIVAAGSYRILEAPFLRLRRRWVSSTSASAQSASEPAPSVAPAPRPVPPS